MLHKYLVIVFLTHKITYKKRIVDLNPVDNGIFDFSSESSLFYGAFFPIFLIFFCLFVFFFFYTCL